MNKKTIKTDLICPECGNVFPIMRKQNKQKKTFHRKWLFCPICKKETNHIEAKELDLLLEQISLKEDYQRTEDEKKVYVLRKRSD